jgi:predicted small secreted protein
MKNVIRLLSLGFIAAALFGTSLACNTTEGVGEDMEDAGDNLKDAARDAKD